MTDTLRASQAGLEKLQGRIQQKRWGRQSAVWCTKANVSLATLKRFWQRKPISTSAFQAICQAAEIDWREVIDDSLERPNEPIEISDGKFWVGRSHLLEDLVKRGQQGCRLLLITGMTGIGKTALAEQLCDCLQTTYPTQRTINLDNHDQATFNQIAPYLPGAILGSPTTANHQTELIKSVVNQLASQPNLLILDGLETLLEGTEETGWSTFKDPLWKQFFKKLLAAQSCRSFVIVTSQDFPAELRGIGSRYSQNWHCEVLKGLTEEEQALFFSKLGLENLSESAQKSLQRIGKAYEGHPLTLQVIAGEILNEPFCGDVLAYWNTYGCEIEKLEQVAQATSNEGEKDALRLDRYTRHLRHIVRKRIESCLNRLSKEVPAAYWLLCLASVYRRSVTTHFWLKMLVPLQLDSEQQALMLDALRDRYLVEEIVLEKQLHLRQHNLIRSIALSHLRQLRRHHHDSPSKHPGT